MNTHFKITQLYAPWMKPIKGLAWLCTQRDNWITRDVTEKDGEVSVKLCHRRAEEETKTTGRPNNRTVNDKATNRQKKSN
jgi:hypothetical protein